jgi:membrane fusion protein
MNRELFRTEAVLASTGPKFGRAVFYQPISVKILIAVLTVIFILFMLFAAFAQIKQTQPVRGYLSPLEGETKIYSSRAGIFQQIISNEGQYVEAGDILATVTDAQFDAAGNQASSMVLEHLDIQKTHLLDQLSLIHKRARINAEQLVSRADTYQRELALLHEENQVLIRRLELAEQEYNSNRALLQRGAISLSEHNQKLSAYYNFLQASKTNLLQIESKQLGLTDARQQLELHPLLIKDELLNIEGALSQLSARRQELESSSTFTITAPVAGNIFNLLSSAGNHADPRVPLLTLIPATYTLEAVLYLPSRALGKVESGQELALSYDAFPYQTYGRFIAHITDISETVMDPREFLIPIELPEPVYLVKAQLQKQYLDDPDLRQLRSGMQFSAEIHTDSQTILQRLFMPFTSLSRKL